MASMVHELARSAIRQLRQPRWNRLLLKPNLNLHLPAIHQQRRFSQGPDKDGGEDQEQKKFCIDYKKNPTIEGHEPPDLPKLEPANPKLKIAKRREFLRKKECEERGRELEKERKEAEENDPCANFSRASFGWGKPKVRTSLFWHKINSCLAELSRLQTLHSDPVGLHQERTFSRKVEQEQAIESSPLKPVPSRSKILSQKRMAIKRRHFQARKKKEAEAKAQALAKLKHACSSNSHIKEDLKITQSNSEPAKEEADPAVVYAKPKDATFTDQLELKQLLKIIKERCKRKCEEFERSREAEAKREAEEAALRNQAKMSKIRELCTEAKKLNSFKMDRLKNICKEAHLRQQSVRAKLANQTKEITSEDKNRVTASSYRKDYSEDDNF